MRPGSATLPRPSTLSKPAPDGMSRITSSGGPIATMRSSDTAIEAGEWIRSPPNSLPRSGPVPTGVTAAWRSWIRSEISAILVILRLSRKVQDHLQLVGIHYFPSAPREELRSELCGDYLRDGPCLVGMCGKEHFQEAGAPTVAPVGAGHNERGQGDDSCAGVSDQDVGVMVEMQGPRRRDRPRERLRGQHPRQVGLALAGHDAREVEGIDLREGVCTVGGCAAGPMMVADEAAQRFETESLVQVDRRRVVLEDLEQHG